MANIHATQKDNNVWFILHHEIPKKYLKEGMKVLKS